MTPPQEGAAEAERRNDARAVAGWPPGAISCDAFLGGRIRACQPVKGFRAGMDSVLLAAAVPAAKGERVMDLGQGAGVASLCLLARVAGVHIDGLEIDPALAALAAENARANGWAGRMACHAGDARRPPPMVPRQSYDHVMTNPPFLEAGRASAGPDPGKARALALTPEDEAAWFKAALALLKPKGWMTIVHRADALGRLLGYLARGTGDTEVIPIYAAADKPAIRVIIRTRKGARGPLKIAPGLTLHGPSGAFAPEAEAILREGAALTTSPG
jgi:tRNA1(Val) A37 N6-methylase TrmN6